MTLFVGDCCTLALIAVGWIVEELFESACRRVNEGEREMSFQFLSRIRCGAQINWESIFVFVINFYGVLMKKSLVFNLCLYKY